MSDNPLEEDPDRDERIKRRAYHLWEADGRPHGNDRDYWERASELIRMEDSGNPGQLPNPATIPGADPDRIEPVEEASIQENLGEFPDRFADQGEAEPFPKPKRTARAKAAADPTPGMEAAPGKSPPITGKSRKPKTAGSA